MIEAGDVAALLESSRDFVDHIDGEIVELRGKQPIQNLKVACEYESLKADHAGSYELVTLDIPN